MVVKRQNYYIEAYAQKVEVFDKLQFAEFYDHFLEFVFVHCFLKKFFFLNIKIN